MARMTKKKYVVLAGAGALALTGGAAFAFWTSTGSGTGSATTGTSSAWVVTIDSTALADLTPGGPTESVTFHVKNANSGAQSLQNAAASVTGTSNSGCTAADFAVGTPAITYGEIASSATVNGTFTLQMIDRAANQDACKGVTVSLKVDAS